MLSKNKEWRNVRVSSRVKALIRLHISSKWPPRTTSQRSTPTSQRHWSSFKIFERSIRFCYLDTYSFYWFSNFKCFLKKLKDEWFNFRLTNHFYSFQCNPTDLLHYNKEYKHFSKHSWVKSGRGERTWTSDLRYPKPF